MAERYGMGADKPRRVGDAVRLVSGGPVMWVSELGPRGCRCEWDGKDSPQSEWFPEPAVTVIPDAEREAIIDQALDRFRQSGGSRENGG